MNVVFRMVRGVRLQRLRRLKADVEAGLAKCRKAQDELKPMLEDRKPGPVDVLLGQYHALHQNLESSLRGTEVVIALYESTKTFKQLREVTTLVALLKASAQAQSVPDSGAPSATRGSDDACRRATDYLDAADEVTYERFCEANRLAGSPMSEELSALVWKMSENRDALTADGLSKREALKIAISLFRAHEL